MLDEEGYKHHASISKTYRQTYWGRGRRTNWDIVKITPLLEKEDFFWKNVSLSLIKNIIFKKSPVIPGAIFTYKRGLKLYKF